MLGQLIYAGIGSRETPGDVLILMQRLAARLAARGYCLRSGDADGADSAFEAGCDAVGGKPGSYEKFIVHVQVALAGVQPNEAFAARVAALPRLQQTAGAAYTRQGAPGGVW